MEDGLVQCYLLNIYNILKLVLIFIVVEDGLVPEFAVSFPDSVELS